MNYACNTLPINSVRMLCVPQADNYQLEKRCIVLFGPGSDRHQRTRCQTPPNRCMSSGNTPIRFSGSLRSLFAYTTGVWVCVVGLYDALTLVRACPAVTMGHCPLQCFPAGNAGKGRVSPAEPSMRRSRFRVKRPGRLTHTTPLTEQVASLMCDEEYGPTQAPIWDMLRDGTVTSSREAVGPQKGPHLPGWAGEHQAHCVPPRHAPYAPMDIAARPGKLSCLAVRSALTRP